MRNLDPLNITFKPIRHGDTWGGITNMQIVGAGTETSSPLSKVRMGWVDADGTLGLMLTTESGAPVTGTVFGSIIIDNPAPNAWLMRVNPITPFPLAVGIWSWAIETTDSDGRIKTYVAGTKEVTFDPTP